MTTFHIRVKLFNQNGFLLRDGVIKHSSRVPRPLIRIGDMTFACVADERLTPETNWYSYMLQSATLSNCHVLDDDFGLVEEITVRTDFVPVESAQLITVGSEYTVIAEGVAEGIYIIKNDQGNLMEKHQERALAAEAELAAIKEKLKDPNAVHLALLRGDIAKPTMSQISHIYGGDYGKEINRIAILLLETWKQVDPDSSVALNDCSYQATFADMAKAIVDDQNTRYVPDVPELKRYKEYWDAGCIESPEGEYVLYAQAAAVIAGERQAAIDARNLLQYEKDQQWRERAEVAEAEIKKLQDILAHSKLFSQKRNENNF